ncbi:hypothetical protein DLJ59_05130 [Micromonospora inaquosa]|uniref:Uncharacterized protein n=1 Tax=Micromonospora inaquosa TaxID=2203716 RepID=A0A3N9X049_9ACTN|nr:hypothetical protein DLJ59_05130 [Micromonospora inaquosa]
MCRALSTASIPTMVMPSLVSQSRSASNALVVVTNVRTSLRRRLPAVGTRIHAFRSALPMSIPPHRSWMRSIKPSPAAEFDQVAVQGNQQVEEV